MYYLPRYLSACSIALHHRGGSLFSDHLRSDQSQSMWLKLGHMLDLPPTTLAVADAVTQYRQRCEMTINELSNALLAIGHDLDPDDLQAIEQCRSIVTVDDLVALAVVLGTTPIALLSHIPIDYPGDGALATGVPADVDQPELRAWMEDKTALDQKSRLRWCQDRVARLRILSAHHDDQLRGALAELEDLGELALQEADMPPVAGLHNLVRQSEYQLSQADTALAYAEMRLEQLQETKR